MSLIRPIQPSFSSGEVSPSIYARTDIAKYQSSLKKLKNFIIHPTGGCSNRPGLIFASQAKYPDRKSIVQEFIFNQDQAYVFEIGHQYIRFFTDGEKIYFDLSTIDAWDSGNVYSSGDFVTYSGDIYRALQASSGTTDADIKLLLNLNGVDGATATTDIAAIPNTMTFNGSAQLDTAQFKYGSASLLLDGTTDYLTTADSASWDILKNNSDSWTVECWWRPNATTYQVLVSQGFVGNNSWTLAWTPTGFSFATANGGFDKIVLQGGGAITIGNWYHVALVILGTGAIKKIGIYLGGQIVGFIQDSYNMEVLGNFAIGAQNNGLFGMNGWFDDIRIIKRNVYNALPDSGLTDTITVPASELSVGGAKQPDLFPDYWDEQPSYEIESPYLEDDLALLNLETSADTIFITHPDYQTRVLQRYGNNDWRMSLYEPEDGPFMPENIESISLAASAVTGVNITLTATSPVFDPDQISGLFKLRHYVQGQTASAAFSSATTGTGIKCFTTWRLISHGTWTGKFRIEKSDDGGTTWTSLRTFSSVADFNANTSGTEDIEANLEPFLVRVNMYEYTSGTANIDLTTDAFYQDGIVKLTTYNSATSVQAEVISEIGATGNTTTWAEGSWSNYRGWPGVARFYQDRLVFAGTYSEPMTLWATQVGNYFSFLRHSTLLDTDGISANLPSRQLNAINGLVAFKRLLVFTSASIWSVGTAGGAPLTPTSFSTDVEEYNGSNGVNPVVIGNEAIYIQQHGKVVSNIGFAFATDSFTGADANILCQHLFDKWEIVDMCYQRTPDRIVWMLRSDGKLIGLTYMKDQEVVGFHQHDTGVDDKFESICIIPGDGFDELWCVVNRANGRTIERLALRMKPEEDADGVMEITAENQLFLDSAVIKQATVAFSTMTGLDHLNGETVGILADGQVQAQRVCAGGTVTFPASLVSYCGLPYDADFQTLAIEIPTKQGTLQGVKTKISNVTFRLLNSRGGMIGPDEDHLYDGFNTLNLSSATEIAVGIGVGQAKLFSVDARLPLGAEYDGYGSVFVRQSDPLPLTISAVVPELAVPNPSVK